MSTRTKANRGFTLIELMIAVCIIGVLAAVAMPTYSHYIMESKSSEGVDVISSLYRGAVVYWEHSTTTQGMAATSAGHCIPTGGNDLDEQNMVSQGMPPLPPVPYKRTANYGASAIFSALGFSRSGGVLFIPLPIKHDAGRADCDGSDGPIYDMLTVCDLDGDGQMGGFALLVYAKDGELSHALGYQTVSAYFSSVFGMSCPFCAPGID